MSIATYSDLQQSVINWLNRSDLSAFVTDFIRLAEDALTADLTARQMDATVSIPTVGGTATVQLPSDLHQMRRFRIDVPYSQPLSYRTPEELSADYSSDAVGQPIVYTVIGSTAELAPTPDAVYSLELVYQQRIPTLSDSSPTNWLLTDWPSAYLWASLLAAEPFLKNDERIATWQMLYQQQIDRINASDWHVATSPRVRAR
ncbi:hypothetical protein [Pseudomonas sp.]|uniref:phage adaptor protein n=1 Tax=Pseudomonas sp. TaxID=306 RepID=UPI0031E00EB4